MFNYNVVDAIQWISVAIYIVIWLCFVFGNWISAKLLNPEHKDNGRIFMGALLLLCIQIFFSIMTAWKAVLPFMYKNPLIGIVGMLVSWYFVCKYLYGHTWAKAVVGALLPIVIAAVAIGITFFVAPNILVDYLGLRLM